MNPIEIISGISSSEVLLHIIEFTENPKIRSSYYLGQTQLQMIFLSRARFIQFKKTGNVCIDTDEIYHSLTIKTNHKSKSTIQKLFLQL